MDIGEWLNSLGLPQFVAAFRSNRIDNATLVSLTEEELRVLRVAALGDRKRILAAAATLRQTTETIQSSPLAELVDRWPSILALALQEYVKEVHPVRVSFRCKSTS